MRPVVLFTLIALATAPATTAVTAEPASSRLVISDDGGEDIPRGTPTDDYGFVAWCYGALDESLGIYETVKPDLKAIDALFGSPVQEDVPYQHDVAGERQALKRFHAAIAAAEKASPTIVAAGAAATAKGRMIWAKAEAMSSRRLADTWLYWGVPEKCESAAQTLKARAARSDQAAAIAAEAAPDLSPVDARMADELELSPPLEAELRTRLPAPAAIAPRRPAPPADPNAPLATAGGSGDGGP
jgi:hypothetical protein